MESLSAKQKWTYASSAVALFSMFLPWFVWGMRSDNGWETNYYIVLFFWFIPLISAYTHNRWKVINVISLLLGSLAFVAFVGENASVRILGETYASHVGAGPYVYLLAWSAAVYSELMVSNETYDANNISGNAISASNNEELFLKVTSDFENNKIDEALWIKSLTICDGDKEKAKYKYIREQVNKLEQELIINNKTNSDKDDTLKTSKPSMGLGIQGMGDINNKKDKEKLISIIVIVLSGILLVIFFSALIF